MSIVSAEQVVGKDLYAKVRVNAYSVAEYNQKYLVNTFSYGSLIGTVSSYVKRGDSIWWMFQEPGKKPFYVLHGSDRFDFKALKEQGTKTVDEQIKEKEDKEKSFYDKILDGLVKAGKYVGGGVILYVIAKEVLNRRKI